MRGGRNPALPHALIVALTLISGARAFGTINEPSIIGQHCEHERITRAAFSCPPGVTISDGRCFEDLSLHQLAGRSEAEGYFAHGSNGAVGAPDLLDPVPEGPHAHCDNADFLDSPLYPQSRKQATAQLQSCTNHLRRRFSEGIDAADQIVDDDGRIFTSAVEISTLDCRFSFPDLQMHLFSRSKCSAIEGFGRSLHGVQDFYAHSNWADDAKPPYGTVNPPGLKRDDFPPFLDLRAENDISDQVPRDLSTGCFGGILTDGPVGKAGHPLEPGSIDCTGRVTHHTLNKDNGIIDEITGVTSTPGPNTPRSDMQGNFARAVYAAIRDSNRQWRHFREEIRRTYGTERGNIIICALVRDNPGTDCYGRKVAFLRDAPKDINRVAEMQIPYQSWLLQELEGRPHDEGPEGDEGPTPRNTTKIRGSSDELHEDAKGEGDKHPEDPLPHISQGLDIGTALEELTGDITSSTQKNKSSIVALTNTNDMHVWSQVPQVWRAGDEGVRVHLGLLPSPKQQQYNPEPNNAITALAKARGEDLITAVLRTGGTYSVLHNRKSIPKFIEHVISRGLTQYDNARDTAILLVPGLSISDYVTPASEPRRFSFDAHTMDNIVISVAPITSRLSLHVCVRHVRENRAITELDIGLGGNSTFRASLGVADIPRTNAWYELEVAHNAGDGLAGSGLFEVSIEMEPVGEGSDSEKRQSDAINGDHEDHDEL